MRLRARVLSCVRRRASCEAASASPRPPCVVGYRTFSDADAAVFLVGDIAALSGRYGALALRLLLLEAGHIGALLQLVCTELGGTALPMGGFYDDEVATALSLDAGQHCLYVWAIG